jgi:SAM-dependent methyltransferase
MTKTYDRAYFEKWYRSEDRVNSAAVVRFKVMLAVSVAEYFLRRKVRSVLDVGCGEAAWLPHLRAMRPQVRYSGVDPSAYVVRQFGRARNIQQGGLADLASLRINRTFDLVVCSDVIHYVNDDDVRSGIREIVHLCAGVAFLEVLTAEDDVVGDLEGLIQRPAAWYRKTFTRAGLVAVAPYTWLAPPLQPVASELERP